MIRAAFIAIYIFVFSLPYVLVSLGVRELFTPFMLYGLPFISGSALVVVTWYRGMEIGMKWLFVLPLIASVSGLVLTGLMFSGSPSESFTNAGNARAVTMFFTVAPIVNTVSFVIYFASFVLGARGVAKRV